MGRPHLATLVVLLGIGTSCAVPATPHEAKRVSALALEAAEGHLQDGNPIEASELVGAVLRIDPASPRAHALRELIGPEVDDWTTDTWLGVNRARRAPADRHFLNRVFLYLPDRFLDLLDVVTLDLHLGFGLYGNVHATRALQVGGGTRAVTGIGLHERRSLGMRSQSDTGVTVVALGAEVTAGRLTGTSGVFSFSDSLVGLHEPLDSPYQEIRDYWALGTSFTVLLLGAELDFHPVQLADFAAGLVALDFLHDDLAGTRRLRLSRYEWSLLRELHEIERVGVAGPR